MSLPLKNPNNKTPRLLDYSSNKRGVFHGVKMVSNKAFLIDIL